MSRDGWVRVGRSFALLTGVWLVAVAASDPAFQPLHAGFGGFFLTLSQA